MEKKDFYYDLPEELIAQTPLKKRSDSRLMILDRKTGAIKHDRFYNILDYISENDVIVFNNTRVLPARLYGEKEDTHAKIEILLLKRISMDTWEILSKPAKRLKEGSKVTFADDKLKMEVLSEKDEGIRIVKFIYEGVFENILEEYGFMPLPPYIKKKLEDRERYQTVYNKIKGSSAAPTAGLHFTEELLEKIKEKNIEMEYLTLHVGLGTFRPVKEKKIEDHKMHSEFFHIDKDVMNRLNKAKKNGKKILAVGTTSVRTLESSQGNGILEKCEGNTDIFIYPGYQYKFVDKMITNFHLPESTLLMMISAFSTKDIIFNAYHEAIKEKYRFFSFGDAMLIR